MSNKVRKVLIGISGGMDSAVAALLLKEGGYLVESLYLRFINSSSPKGPKEMAKKLGIPFHAMDLRREFADVIIDPFCREYLKGRAPNPCVVCNRLMKFEFLLQKADEAGIQFVATGHYARCEYDKQLQRYIIREALDKKKDQSYFLSYLTHGHLSRVILPLGEHKKEEVADKAGKLGLNFKRGPSYEACFVAPEGRDKVIKKRYKDRIRKGHILDREGRVLGTHRGVCLYTLGQRRGLGIARGKPIYITSINSERDEIVVGEKEDLKKNELIAADVNWVSIPSLEESTEVEVKIRYLHPKEKATLYPLPGEKVKLRFKEPQFAITPGQLAAFYRKDILLGGGWIV